MPNVMTRTLILVPMLALLPACGGTAERESGYGPDAATVALRMVGKPYRYGGNTPRGFDCSGLVQYSYKKAGASVPRSTRSQRSDSRFVAREQMRKGDLLFFNQEGKWSSHVGIYIGNNRFAHAPSSGKKVRVDTISNYWQRSLVDVRRF